MENRAHGVGGDNNRLDNSFVFPAGCSLGTVYRKYRASTNVFTDVSDWSRELESTGAKWESENDDRCLERMKGEDCNLHCEPFAPSVLVPSD